METKTRWHSCRLAPYGDSGRIKWCVGHETAWRLKVKVLIFVPILLLSVTLIAILCTHMHQSNHSNTTETSRLAKAHYHDSEVTDTEEREVLHDIKTSYIPIDFPFESSSGPYPFTRQAREVQISAIPFKRKFNFTDYDYLYQFNKSDEYEDFQFSGSRILSWKTPLRETKITGLKIHPRFREADELDANFDNDYYDNPPEFWKDQITYEAVRNSQASMMKKFIDNNVNPCDDFYQYACGNWEKYNPIPPDKAGYDTFEILRENLDAILRDILAEPDNEKDLGIFPTNSNHLEDKIHFANKYDLVHNNSFSSYDNYLNYLHDPLSKVKNLYKSCMNEDIINQRAEKPLLRLLQQLGGWPILESNWNESQFDWLWLAAHLRLYNNDILISQWVGPDIKNSAQYVIQFDQTTLGLPSRDYFLEESNLKYLEAYRIYMLTTASLLGASVIPATQDIDQMINFEIKLAKITAAPEERRNVSEIYMRVTVGELQSVIPQIDWIRYLNIIMNTQIQSTEPVVCFSMTYLQDLVELLSFTPSRTIANYLLWRFVRHRINNLDNRFQEAKQRFYYVLFGREKLPPRWQTCVTQVNSNMGMALGNLFVQKYFDEKSKNDTLQMTKEIQQAFRELISSTTWLDSDTKHLAKLKIDAMRLRIGYPDFILNIDELSERYSDVQISPNLYFENTLSILQHLTRAEQARLGTAVNKTMWNTAPAIVNAYYSRNKNQIMFPAGILQPPFYQRYFPRSLNYGGIGVVIGHEITHGFDDKGRLFDKEGNLQRWWKEHAVDEFHDRAQCLIDQYNKYIVPEVNMQVDGTNTQGENIADNGGIKQAFKAYTRWLEKNPYTNDTLPGFNATNKQLFFLNFAQVWCGSARPEATRNKLKTAVHSPGRFRVIGTVSNSKDFAEAYHCPLGSPMNPTNKCSIW